MQPPPPPQQRLQLPALSPNDVETIFNWLQNTLSNVTAQQKASEAALKEHESREGFCSCLAEIVGTKAAEYSARFSAAVQMKNCIIKYWRPRLKSASLTATEKQHLRQKLLELLPQEDSQIALQIAVTFAKVARMEFPKAWPTLVTDVMTSASSSPLAARRAYVVLHHLLKELSTKRLAADQRTFAQVTAQLYEGLWEQWRSDTQHLIDRLPAALVAHPQPEHEALVLERWLILLKALRRLVVYGFEHDHRSLQQVPVVSQVLPEIHRVLTAMLPMRATAPRPPSKLHAMLNRALLKLAKVSTNILEAHPWSCFHCGALQNLTAFFADHLVISAESSSGAQQSNRRFLIRSMLFLQTALRASTFRRPMSAVSQLAAFKLSGSSEQEASVQSMQAQLLQVQSAFWDSNRLSTMIRSLVLNYFPLTAEDLISWHADAEEFFHDADVSSFHDNLRTCAETLYLVLFERNREVVAPLVLSLAQAACNSSPPGDAAQIVARGGAMTGGVPNEILTTDATLSAMGVGAFELHDYVDFGPWFSGTLLPAMRDGANEAAPLRLRAALVIAKWTPRMEDAHRSAAYEALLSLLASSDAAVQLASISALQALLDDWGFTEASFGAIAGRMLHLLADFVRSAEQLDSQLQAFHLFGIVIDRLQEEVAPFAPAILQLLPEVWAAADSRPLIRSQVLTALQRLLVAAGPAGAPPDPETFLLPALRYSCDPAGPEALNLLEDGLATWLTALRCSPTLEQRLVDLFPLLDSVMRHSTEHVQVAASIMSSCLLMDGAAFLSRHGPSLASTLASSYSAVGERGVLALLPVAQLIMTAWPAEGAPLLQDLLLRLLATVLQGEESSVVITSCLSVFARLMVHNGNAFTRLLAHAATLPVPIFQQHISGDPQAAQALLAALLDIWLDKTDSIGSPPDRKLSAAALEAALTAVPSAVLLPRVDVIVAHITSVCYEMEGEGDDDRYRYSVLAARRGGDLSGGAVVASEEAEGESQRWMQLYDADHVTHMRLSETLRKQVAAAITVHGPQFTAALQALDPNLQSQLSPILNA